MKKTTAKTTKQATAKELTALEKQAKKYRLPMTSTPEELEMRRLKTLKFGTKLLAAGYYYTYKENCYYAAVYEFTGKNTQCDGEIKLIAVSDERFEDDGHAVQWALTH